jgi:hypothetical protein
MNGDGPPPARESASALPIVFLLGTFTWARLVRTALEDVIAVGAIGQIRRYYATLLPGAEGMSRW